MTEAEVKTLEGIAGMRRGHLRLSRLRQAESLKEHEALLSAGLLRHCSAPATDYGHYLEITVKGLSALSHAGRQP